MTRFIDGPAKGISLSLRTAPIFLRVVHMDKAKREWDALDDYEDTPSPEETIHVYILAGTPGTCHIDGRDPKTGKRFGRWEVMAEYRIWRGGDPLEDEKRITELWQKWCARQEITPGIKE